MNSNLSYSPETLNSGQNGQFFYRWDLKIWWMTSKTIGHPFNAISSFVHHFVAIGEFWNWSYSMELQNLGQNQRFFYLFDLEICWMTLKNKRAPLFSIIKLCTSFHHHMWIQTGVMVRKQLNSVLTYVTLTFDLWPWPFAWTSLLSLVIPPEVSWWYDDGNMVKKVWRADGRMGKWTDRETERQTDWQTDRRTEPFLELLGPS